MTLTEQGLTGDFPNFTLVAEITQYTEPGFH
jgi:hypothetical protein